MAEDTDTDTEETEETEDNQNPDLQELHRTLGKLQSKLMNALGDAEDGNAFDALNHEIGEVVHRITLVGNLLFTAQTARISAAMSKVREATADVNAAVAKLNNITAVITGITSFLTLVDKVIDTAKLVLAVA